MKFTGSALVAFSLVLSAHAGVNAAQHMGAPATDPAVKANAGEDSTRRASPEAALRKARKDCQAQEGAERKACLRDAKAANSSKAGKAAQKSTADGRSTTAGTPSSAGAAVQTQSAKVNATGVAPPAVDHRTPGRPVTPSK
jgi:hypothetical protein